MRTPRTGSDATVSWMTDDIAQRCRDALDVLSNNSATSVQLGNAAMLLRSAADDLVSMVEVVEGPGAATAPHVTPAFGLSFGTGADQEPGSAG